jgi:hypothetical protein
MQAAAGAACAQSWVAQLSGTTASLRGVSAVNPAVIWASGAGGNYLRTLDGGATWHAAVLPGAAGLDFRSVRALDSGTAWLMSSGPGAPTVARIGRRSTPIPTPAASSMRWHFGTRVEAWCWATRWTVGLSF